MMTSIRKTSPTFSLRVLRNWLEPRSQDRDEAFRERVIRATVTIIILLGLVSFALNLLVFDSDWSLISFRTLHIVALTSFSLAGFIVSRGRLLESGFVLVISLLLGASGFLLLARQEGSFSSILTGIPAFMFVPLVTTLVLPRQYIIPMSIASVLVYLFMQFGVQVGTFAPADLIPERLIAPVVVLLMIEGVLLHQFRVEFDSRLQATQEAVRQAEVARQQAEADRQLAEAADKAKTQFLANMSHELRTPMNAIIGYDEAMLGGMVGTFTPEQTRLLGHIQNNSRRLLGLINDVLDLSKIEAGSVEIYLTPISPRKVIEQSVESVRSLALEKDIDLRVSFTDDVPGIILADAKKLQQILVNLVGNAIKFTDQGGVTIEVDLVDNEHWQFIVRDTGIGIPRDSLATIFEPFRQVDNSSTRRYKGTGLGLSITKRLVEILNGNIQVTSEIDKGSTFAVTLPRVNAPVGEESLSPVQEVG